jgi:hypothetical protein
MENLKSPLLYKSYTKPIWFYRLRYSRVHVYRLNKNGGIKISTDQLHTFNEIESPFQVSTPSIYLCLGKTMFYWNLGLPGEVIYKMMKDRGEL